MTLGDETSMGDGTTMGGAVGRFMATFHISDRSRSTVDHLLIDPFLFCRYKMLGESRIAQISPGKTCAQETLISSRYPNLAQYHPRSCRWCYAEIRGEPSAPSQLDNENGSSDLADVCTV